MRSQGSRPRALEYYAVGVKKKEPLRGRCLPDRQPLCGDGRSLSDAIGALPLRRPVRSRLALGSTAAGPAALASISSKADHRLAQSRRVPDPPFPRRAGGVSPRFLARLRNLPVLAPTVGVEGLTIGHLFPFPSVSSVAHHFLDVATEKTGGSHPRLARRTPLALKAPPYTSNPVALLEVATAAEELDVVLAVAAPFGDGEGVVTHGSDSEMELQVAGDVNRSCFDQLGRHKWSRQDSRPKKQKNDLPATQIVWKAERDAPDGFIVAHQC